MAIMIWTPIVAALYVCSSLATFMTMVHLRFRWDVHASSFRWLFWLFFTYLWIWCVFRSAYMLWKCTLPNHGIVDHDNRSWTYSDLDRLGVHAVLQLQVAHEAWMTCLLVAGDVALLGLALTTFPLTYELAAIARMSMDRGVVKEQAMTRRYSWSIHTIVILFAIAELTISIVYGGYTKHTHHCILGVYIVQFIGLAYMVFQLVCLKVHGRKYETIHGTFVASPVYRRLKTIMTIYVFFSFQFQVSYLIFQITDTPNNDSVTKYMGITLIIYAASGLALSITTSCSQSCVLSACSTCLSDEFELHYLHQRYALQKEAPCEADFIAPSKNPIFVFTDIDSSSSLWALECSELMEQATEIHDRILRTALPEHRGYEIATCGDAFQVAFHTIKDAVEYCVDVQLQLLVAKWPKELATVGIPATARQRCGRRLVFNGLRVRMGIHDAHDSEGVLIQDSHVITGKTTYIGASEVIAAFVGDLGSGGQILVTQRIAAWLQHHVNTISVDCSVDRIGLYSVPQVSTQIEVYQVLPLPLVGRKSFFSVPSDPPIPRREGSASRSLRRMAAMSQSRIGFVPIEQMA